MTLEEAQHILKRINDTWPAKTLLTPDQYGEWLGFLRPYELKYAQRALHELRAEREWRPTMAHFRRAYYAAASAPEKARRALAGEITTGLTLSDIFGSDRERWIYCSECDGAISLEEQITTAIWDSARGLRHARCPRPGAAPMMPAAERAKRAERFSRAPA